MEFCRRERLPYVLDPTNRDPTYTTRNRIRHEIEALRVHDVLYRWESRLARRRDDARQQLTEAMKDAKVHLGRVAFDARDFGKMQPSLRKALLVALARLVSPTPPSQARNAISPENLDLLDASVFGLGSRSVFTPGLGVAFSPRQNHVWHITRQPPRRGEDLSMDITPGTWRLWDERFWVKVEVYGNDNVELAVRPTGRYVLPRGVVRPDSTAGRIRRRLDSICGKAETACVPRPRDRSSCR